MMLYRILNRLMPFISAVYSWPAKLKGMKFGKNSYIRPGYDIFYSTFRGMTVGDNVVIGYNAWIDLMPYKGSKPKVTIGDGSAIGRFFKLSCSKNVTIGKKCLISYNVTILDVEHRIDLPDKAPIDSGLTVPAEVIIDDECFIGAHSFILKGVHLGKHCVVGANSVVTRSFPPFSLVAGNPAKLIRKLK